MTDKKIGFAMCGSFCTFERTLKQLELLSHEYKIQPIMSQNAYTTDTRFGSARSFIERVEDICGAPVWHKINEVEPIGPKKLIDLLIIAPCTGNTLAKLALGITDTSVTMAAKAHLRNERPVLLAPATNDALSGSAKNIGALMNTRGIYFVPLCQDDPQKKHRSVVADIEQLPECAALALEGRQKQPMLIQYT